MPPTPPRPAPGTNSDEEESDDETYPNREAYFLEPNPQSNRQTWLVQFFQFLETPAAGYLKDRNKLQHATKVLKILEEIDPEGDDVLVLGEDEGNCVWVDWVQPNLNVEAGSTLKSYLN